MGIAIDIRTTASANVSGVGEVLIKVGDLRGEAICCGGGVIKGRDQGSANPLRIKYFVMIYVVIRAIWDAHSQAVCLGVPLGEVEAISSERITPNICWGSENLWSHRATSTI